MEDIEGFLNYIIFRMETLGRKCPVDQYEKKVIQESEVLKKDVLKDIDFKSSK